MKQLSKQQIEKFFSQMLSEGYKPNTQAFDEKFKKYKEQQFEISDEQDKVNELNSKLPIGVGFKYVTPTSVVGTESKV